MRKSCVLIAYIVTETFEKLRKSLKFRFKTTTGRKSLQVSKELKARTTSENFESQSFTLCNNGNGMDEFEMELHELFYEVKAMFRIGKDRDTTVLVSANYLAMEEESYLVLEENKRLITKRCKSWRFKYKPDYLLSVLLKVKQHTFMEKRTIRCRLRVLHESRKPRQLVHANMKVKDKLGSTKKQKFGKFRHFKYQHETQDGDRNTNHSNWLPKQRSIILGCSRKLIMLLRNEFSVVVAHKSEKLQTSPKFVDEDEAISFDERCVEISEQLIHGEVKFHLKPKWRSRLYSCQKKSEDGFKKTISVIRIMETVSLQGKEGRLDIDNQMPLVGIAEKVKVILVKFSSTYSYNTPSSKIELSCIELAGGKDVHIADNVNELAATDRARMRLSLWDVAIELFAGCDRKREYTEYINCFRHGTQDNADFNQLSGREIFQVKHKWRYKPFPIVSELELKVETALDARNEDVLSCYTTGQARDEVVSLHVEVRRTIEISQSKAGIFMYNHKRQERYKDDTQQQAPKISWNKADIAGSISSTKTTRDVSRRRSKIL